LIIFINLALKINFMMKLKLFFMLVLLVPVLSFAQRGGGTRGSGGWDDNDASTLSIFSENGDQFFLVLNGVNQNNVPTTKIRVEGLPQYGNDVEILFADRRTQAIRKRVTIADPVDGKAVNMTLKLVRGRDGFPRLKFHKCSEVDRNYRAPEDEYCMTYGQPRRTTTTTYTTTTRTDRGPRAMDGRTFDEAKRSISNSSFDDTKLSTAKTILANNFVTTNQVIEICNLFSFEDRKLAFAKYAYSRTVDPGNYFMVGNAFTFDSNKRALNEFISSNGR
jgi:hypothetical protein